MSNGKHKELCQKAINWLYARGCNVFANEVPTWNGVADAVGVITNASPTAYYIEAKASRSDMLRLKQKSCYKMTEEAMKGEVYEQSIFSGQVKYKYPNDIDFFYFIVADVVKVEPSLYPLWGVINENGIVIRKATRIKTQKDKSDLITAIAHVLVYKVFGKMYLTPNPEK